MSVDQSLSSRTVEGWVPLYRDRFCASTRPTRGTLSAVVRVEMRVAKKVAQFVGTWVGKWAERLFG